MKHSILAFVILTGSTAAQATTFPSKYQVMEDTVSATSITAGDYNAIVGNLQNMYAPLAKSFGGELQIHLDWPSKYVNATAGRDSSGKVWHIWIPGGMARRKEITRDGFTLVLCHELGHHFAGYYFLSNTYWSASEGQADYYASQVCAKKVWETDTVANATFRKSVSPFVKAKCDQAYSDQSQQNLCYRTAAAGRSMANMLAKAFGNGKLGRYSTPDPTQVAATLTDHPRTQCRLDTYLQGALCTQPPYDHVIPGLDLPRAHNSVAAEKESGKVTCLASQGYSLGARPRCWFKPAQ